MLVTAGESEEATQYSLGTIIGLPSPAVISVPGVGNNQLEYIKIEQIYGQAMFISEIEAFGTF